MEAYQITKQDIAALRTCDSVVLRYGHRYSANDCQIEAIKRASDTSPWEQTHIIPTSARITSYDENRTVKTAFCLLYNDRYPNHNPSPLTTLVSLLKVGDVLTVEWQASGDNDYSRNAGLHLDTVTVHITRGTDDKVTRYCFNLAHSICPDNTARMCQMVAREALRSA